MVLTRAEEAHPDQGETSDEDYQKQLIDHIKVKVPLEDLSDFTLY